MTLRRLAIALVLLVGVSLSSVSLASAGTHPIRITCNVATTITVDAQAKVDTATNLVTALKAAVAASPVDTLLKQQLVEAEVALKAITSKLKVALDIKARVCSGTTTATPTTTATQIGSNDVPVGAVATGGYSV